MKRLLDRKLLFACGAAIALALLLFGCSKKPNVPEPPSGKDVTLSLVVTSGSPGTVVNATIKNLTVSTSSAYVLFDSVATPIFGVDGESFSFYVPLVQAKPYHVFLVDSVQNTSDTSTFNVNPVVETGLPPGAILSEMVATTSEVYKTLDVLGGQLKYAGLLTGEDSVVLTQDLGRVEGMLQSIQQDLATIPDSSKKLVEGFLKQAGIAQLFGITGQGSSLKKSLANMTNLSATFSEYDMFYLLVHLDAYSMVLSDLKAGIEVAGLAVAVVAGIATAGTAAAVVGPILMEISVGLNVADNFFDGIIPTDLDSLRVSFVPIGASELRVGGQAEVKVNGYFSAQKNWAAASVDVILSSIFAGINTQITDKLQGVIQILAVRLGEKLGVSTVTSLINVKPIRLPRPIPVDLSLYARVRSVQGIMDLIGLGSVYDAIRDVLAQIDIGLPALEFKSIDFQGNLVSYDESTRRITALAPGSLDAQTVATSAIVCKPVCTSPLLLKCFGWEWPKNLESDRKKVTTTEVLPLGEDVVVHFPDANLEAAIRTELDIPSGELHASQLAKLGQLYEQHAKFISSLSGIRYCKNLMILTLQGDGNKISDINELAQLTRLSSLFLETDQQLDLTPLNSMTSLTRLSLRTPKVTDLSPIRDLMFRLKHLGLYSMPQCNYAIYVPQLTNLPSLTLEGCGLSAIDQVLQNKPNLVELNLSGNQISDISFLSQFQGLTHLNLRGNAISDIRPLSSMSSLLHLDLSGDFKIGGFKITDISAILLLTSLQSLSLAANQIEDISQIGQLRNLTHLNLAYNKVEDITSLSQLSGLETLILDYNRIVSIDAVSTMSSLYYVSVYANGVTDLEPLLRNGNLGARSSVHVGANPLSEHSMNTVIPALRARGVIVRYLTAEWLGDTTTPNAVGNLRVDQVGSNSVTLAWTASGNDWNLGLASFYDIRYVIGSQLMSSNWEAATRVTSNPTPQFPGSLESFTITGLASSTQYSFNLKVGDNAGNWSTLTAGVHPTTLGSESNQPPSIPAVASPVNGATGQPLHGLLLNWQSSDPNNDPLKYDVYFGSTSVPPLVAQNLSVLSYAAGDLLYNSKYYWRVVVRDGHNPPVPGNTWSFTTTDMSNQPPEKPHDPFPLDNATKQPIAGVMLSWQCSDPEGDPLTYDVYFGNATSLQLVSSGQAQTSFNSGYLLYASDYYWKIVAHDARGGARQGPVWKFRTKGL